VKTSQRRPLVTYLEQSYRVGERNACCVLEVPARRIGTRAMPNSGSNCACASERSRQTRVRFGYRMIRVLLDREGWRVGKDLVYRLYKEEGLGLRKRPAGRRRAVVQRQERFTPTGLNQAWAMDFGAP
jgi:putative transposase